MRQTLSHSGRMTLLPTPMSTKAKVITSQVRTTTSITQDSSSNSTSSSTSRQSYKPQTTPETQHQAHKQRMLSHRSMPQPQKLRQWLQILQTIPLSHIQKNQIARVPQRHKREKQAFLSPQPFKSRFSQRSRSSKRNKNRNRNRNISRNLRCWLLRPPHPHRSH